MWGERVKAFKVIKDPEAFQLLADETRRKIIYLLRAKERTVSQLAGELDRTPQAIYHHIHKMRDAGLVEVAREERVDHFIETYFQATAEVFQMSYGEGKPGYAESRTLEALKGLESLGFAVSTDPESMSRIVDLERRIDRFGISEETLDRIVGLENVDFVMKQDLGHYAKLASMNDAEFAEYLRLQEELRRLLHSEVTEPPPPRSSD